MIRKPDPADTRDSRSDWIADAPSRALPTRDFADGAHHGRLIPALQIRRPPPRSTGTAIEHSTRLRQARALLHDGTLGLTVRIAGCRVLLYGQHVSRIVTLRSSGSDSRALVLANQGSPSRSGPPSAGLCRLHRTHGRVRNWGGQDRPVRTAARRQAPGTATARGDTGSSPLRDSSPAPPRSRYNAAVSWPSSSASKRPTPPLDNPPAEHEITCQTPTRP
jgi:hypothetical protein